MRKMKKALVGILAATMLMATALTAAATDSDEGSSSSPSVSTEAASIKSSGATMSVAGSSVKTSIGGGYFAKEVDGQYQCCGTGSWRKCNHIT